jgi:hypothetical protein
MLPYVVLALGYTAAAVVSGWCWWRGGHWRQASLAAGIIATQSFFALIGVTDGGRVACVLCGWVIGLLVAAMPAWLISMPMEAADTRLLKRSNPLARSQIGIWALTVVGVQICVLGFIAGTPLQSSAVALVVAGAWSWRHLRRPGGVLAGQDEALFLSFLVMAPLLAPAQMLVNGRLPDWSHVLASVVGGPVTFTIWLPFAAGVLFGLGQVAGNLRRRYRTIVVAACAPLVYLSFGMPIWHLAGVMEYAAPALLLSFVQAAGHVLVAVARR